MDISIEETDPSSMEYALKRSLLSRNKLAIILKTDTGETQYCCVECPIKYTDKDKLEMHLCTHNKEYRFLCGICGTGLKRKEHLDRHTQEHQEVRPHKCPECGKAFKRKEHLNIHRTIHKGDKDQVCTLCNRSFIRKDHLQKHLQTHSKLFLEHNMYPLDDQAVMEMKEGQDYIEIKEEAFLDIKEEITEEDDKEYNAHGIQMEYEVVGERIIDEYTSPRRKASVDVRTPDSHATGRPFVCTVCYKSYKRKDHLKIHSWTHLKKDKECTGCGKTFHMEMQLAAHMHTCMQVHLKKKASQADDSFDVEDQANDLLVETTRTRRADPESRPHECPVCQRRFKRRQHLKVHANVHLRQEATIWCSLCSAGFHSNTQFEQHHCTAQPDPEEADEDARAPAAARDDNENAFPEVMLQEMVEDYNEESSQLAEPDEQNIPVPQRVFVCRYCQKPFKRRDHYKIHLHIHTGVKDFFCPDCGKGFYRKDHLQKHSQTHSKSKPKPKKQLPDLFPISMMPKKTPRDVKPEITITAPSTAKLRVPLQIKVPYQMVVARADAGPRS